ncbi:MAG: VanZ family protein [Clostridiales bacterium]|nr:VanZ family protein [Clostridiales bacterium]
MFSIVMWILVVSWMIVIFSLSSETGDVSAVRSQDLVSMLNSSLKLYLSEAFVRKVAHVIEFLVLSILAYIAMFATKHIQSDVSWNTSKLIQMKSDNEVYIAFALWVTALSSVADEYHQIFVSGRSASFFDVFLDMSGAIVLMVIIRVVVSIRVIVKNRKSLVDLTGSDNSLEGF